VLQKAKEMVVFVPNTVSTCPMFVRDKPTARHPTTPRPSVSGSMSEIQSDNHGRTTFGYRTSSKLEVCQGGVRGVWRVR